MRALHASRGVDEEDHIVAVHRDPADRVGVDATTRPRRLGQPLVGLLQFLVSGEQFVLDDVAHRRLLARGVELAAQCAHVARCTGQIEPLAFQQIDTSLQLPLQHLAVAADGEQLLLQAFDLRLEVLPRALDHERLPELRQHEQQDDRAEPAADHIEERQAEDLGLAPLQSHTSALTANPSRA